MADVLRLDLGTGDADALSLFDSDTYHGPDVLGPIPPPAIVLPRCPACHGRTDDRSPRCTCDHQPDGIATAQTLADVEHPMDPTATPSPHARRQLRRRPYRRPSPRPRPHRVDGQMRIPARRDRPDRTDCPGRGGWACSHA